MSIQTRTSGASVKPRLHNLFPILLFTATLILTGCFEKKKEEVIESPSTGGGGGGSSPSNNYGYVTLAYPSHVSGTYKIGSTAESFPDITPTSNINGASLTTFTISPSLPYGLSMDPNTGNISGTVYSRWSEQTYTISAQKPDNEGAVTTTINFGINDHAGFPVDNSSQYSDLRYPVQRITLVVGQAVSLAAPTYSGPQDITFFSCAGCGNSPGTGEFGLTYDPATGAFSGTPFQPMAERVFYISADNGSIEATLILNVLEGAPSNLHYTNENATYPVGLAITANTPTASGGNIASFSVSPALPSGLSLNTTTGEITGTPTVIQTSANYTITATNVIGSTTRQISIAVPNAAPVGLTYSSVSSRYTVGASITANTPSFSGGGQATSFSINPTLPNGLNFNTTTGVITGLPASMTAATSYTVTASNAVGSVNKVIGITVVNPGSHVLYQANGGLLKAYSVDDVTGEPIFVGNQISSGVNSKLKFHPSSDCAFGYTGGSIESYSIDKSNNGKLTSVNSVGGLAAPRNMVMSASGQFLFVLNDQDPNTQFIRKVEVNPSDCSLSNATSFSVQYSTVYFVRDLALAGNNIYVNYSAGSGKIRHLQFDGTGALSFVQDYTGGGERFITASNDGNFIYSTGDQFTKGFSVAGNGNLTQDYNFGDNSRFVIGSVYPASDPATGKLIKIIQNGFAAYGIEQMGFANDGTINQLGKLEGNNVIQYYSQVQKVSVHTSQSGTYVYSEYNPSLGGPTPNSVRLKIESNGAITSKGAGLLGHISGY